jgi:hypothetical protein
MSLSSTTMTIASSYATTTTSDSDLVYICEVFSCVFLSKRDLEIHKKLAHTDLFVMNEEGSFL